MKNKAMTSSAMRLLLVDDSKEFREALAIVLKLEGFDVVGEAGTGEEALRLVQSLQPDIVLMDVCLPGMDGVRVTTELLKIAPKSRVIGLSLSNDGEIARQMMMAGACVFIPKDKASNLIKILRGLGETLVGHSTRKIGGKQTVETN